MALPEKEIREAGHRAVGFEWENVPNEDHLYILGSWDNGLT